MSNPNIKVIANKQFWLNARDFIRGALIAIITAALTVIQNSVQDGAFSFKWKNVATISITAFIAYILKNWLSPSTAVMELKTNDPKALSQQMKEASTINIDKSEGQSPIITTSVG